MKWSWRIGRFAGIDLFMHATFLLIIGWIGFSYWQQTQTLGGTLEGILFTLVLFGCVVLHEFGHALSARRYGIKTRDITLYPIGGVARLERMPEKPIQEFWVALAGPSVNIAIALLIFGGLTLSGSIGSFSDLSMTSGSFIERLLLINLSLVLFNLIPAFPMDGGRVLRSLLAMRLEYRRATQIAVYIGQGLALVFAIFSLFSNPFLLFIAFFVWIGAAQEASLVQMKSTLGSIPVGQAMLTDFQVLSSRDNIRRAVELILSGLQSDFPVMDGKTLVGILTRSDIMMALSRMGLDVPVTSVMHHEFQTVEVNENLDSAFVRLQTCGCNTIPVTYQGQLVGLLTAENIGKFLTLQSKLSKTRRQDNLFPRGV